MISSAVLQWIAAITMVADHIGLFLLTGTPAYAPLRIIGRLAMPIYIFMLTEGFRHTKQRDKYFLRILIFAFISQLPYDLLAWRVGLPVGLNIMFTLAAALMAMSFAERGGWWWLAVAGLGLLAQVGKMDYGMSAILMTVGLYLASKHFHKTDDRLPRVMGYAAVLLFSTLMTTTINNWLVQLFAILALIPIALYNGKKGHRMPKYFFYVFYPAHLLVILMVNLVLFAI